MSTKDKILENLPYLLMISCFPLAMIGMFIYGIVKLVVGV